MLRGKFIVALICVFGLTCSVFATTKESMKVSSEDVVDKSNKCITCHLKEDKSIVTQWENSTHSVEQVSCYTCHAAKSDDPIGYEHEGAFIKTIISPNDCAFCHSKIVQETTASKHASAASVMYSNDGTLASMVASPHGDKKEFASCTECHGSVIAFEKDKEGKFVHNKAGAPITDFSTWPNSGAGRVNPDGSVGSCNSCHSGHNFSASRARQPENCAKCHSGDDHPQAGAYDSSKHAIAYASSPKGEGNSGMNIYKKGEWTLAADYNEAPTCATCHMGSYRKSTGGVVKATHNVGDRIAWSLKDEVSKKRTRVVFTDKTMTDINDGDKIPEVEEEYEYVNFVKDGDKMKKIATLKEVAKIITPEKRQEAMKGVCASCHSSSRVDNFYKQFDASVNTYNEKYAKPALALLEELKKDGLYKDKGFEDGELAYLWFGIWHKAGKAARNGAAMQSPRYEYWEGFHEVSRIFYSQFLPKVQEVANAGKQGAKYKKLINAIKAKK
ncbi:MAG: hypothetical protein IBX44_09755 [Sulfurospirillum sp.]|nr:hypothetical protein [Sulfurospirillum sp.]